MARSIRISSNYIRITFLLFRYGSFLAFQLDSLGPFMGHALNRHRAFFSVIGTGKPHPDPACSPSPCAPVQRELMPPTFPLYVSTAWVHVVACLKPPCSGLPSESQLALSPKTAIIPIWSSMGDVIAN